MNTWIIVGLVVVLLFIKDWIDKLKRKPIGVPGPAYYFPWVGNYFEVINPDTGVTQAAWQKKFGDVICYYLFGSYRILLTDPADVKHVLLNNHLFDKNIIQYRILSVLLGNGLVTEQNEELHKYHRSIISPAFAHAHLRGLVPIFQQKGGILVEDWLSTSGTGKLVDIKDDIAKATSDVIGEAAFAYKLHSQRNDSPNSIYTIFAHLVGGTGLSLLDAVPIIKNLTPSYKRRMKAINTLNSEVKQIIDQKTEIREKKAKQKENQEIENLEEKPREKRDLLDILMDCSNEEGAMLTPDELAGQTKTFLLAGYETSSVCILWTLHLLSKYQDIQQKLADEVISVIGRDRNPSAEDIDQMPYLQKVVQESLRICPPIPLVARRASEDVYIKGHLIPKDTHVIISIYHQHHNPAVWKDPETFNPERWTNSESEATAHLGSFIPFILGARNCIGNRFALLEVKVILAMVVQKLSFLPEPGQPDPGRKSRISMTPRRNINLTFEQRK